MLLSFRPVAEGDVDDIHRLHSDPATNLHNPYGAAKSMDDSSRVLHGYLEHWRTEHFGYELVFDGADLEGRALVGICGVRRDHWQGAEVLNLYWRLLPEFHGQGLAAPLATRALEQARGIPGSASIVARMLPDNTASAHVAERLGLVRRPELDGELDGASWIVYADAH